MRAALPAAIALTGLAGIALTLLSRRRRRRRLREAVHELRRPLAALLLAAEREPVAAALREQAEVALADLDAAIEGVDSRPRRRVPVHCSRLLAEARQRWRGSGVEIACDRADFTVAADPVHLGMALDNLIANGLEHGGGEVRVRARRAPDGGLLEVTNGVDGRGPRPRRPDPARGHGLRIAARQLEADGGRLLPPRRAGADVVAALELPLASPPSAGRP